MKTIEDSKKLARIMVDIGKNAGKKTLAMITNMDIPLGNAIGNSLEVKEAIAVLKGQGPADLTEVCIELATEMLYLAEHGSEDECRNIVKKAISSGRAFETLCAMVEAQGGDVNVIRDPELFKKAQFSHEVCALSDGYITKVDAEGYGIASLILGAGRNKKEDAIDYDAGIILKAKTGDFVKKGDVIAVLYSNKKESFKDSCEKVLASTVIGSEKPILKPLILGKVD